MSTIKTETLSTPSNATVPVDTVVNGTAKAWVNFNGTGTVAIRRAFNVSSITDGGTGNYTVNFTTAMPDTNYSLIGIANGFSSIEDNGAIRTGSRSTSSIQVRVTNGAVTVYVDSSSVQVAIFS